MKLLTKYRLYSYTSLLFIVIVGFVLDYYLFRYSIHQTTDDVLNEYRIDVENYVEANEEIQSLYFIGDKLSAVRVLETPQCIDGVDETIRDTLVFSHYEKEMVVYRKLDFTVSSSDRHYLVTIMLPALEEHALAATIMVSLIILVVLFIVFTTLVDSAFAQKILHPFERILEVMRTYNLEERTKVQLNGGDIDEFRDLVIILDGMMLKINQGYDEMKEFLEYTSHELKTPLAIIQLKLEDLHQTKSDDETVLSAVTSIQSSLNRIIRFNRSLLFIAKIKNDQFSERKPVNMNGIIVNYFEGYEELLNVRNLKADFEQNADFWVDIHPLLAEQLIHNILTNAMLHNVDQGFIHVWAGEKEIRFSNSFAGKLPEGDLFEKYNYSAEKTESTGLGLTIVKNICIKTHLRVRYEIKDEVFILIVEK